MKQIFILFGMRLTLRCYAKNLIFSICCYRGNWYKCTENTPTMTVVNVFPLMLLSVLCWFVFVYSLILHRVTENWQFFLKKMFFYFNRDQLNNHLDNVQGELEALKEFLRVGDEYQMDPNTLLNVSSFQMITIF